MMRSLVVGVFVLLCVRACAQEERGAIAGQVLTAEGDPAPGAVVDALKLESGAARKVGAAVADDRGVYRLYDLAPGKYALRLEAIAEAHVAGGSYPLGERDAAVMVVEPGVTVGGKDFVLPAVEAASSDADGEAVSGEVVSWSMQLVGNARVELVRGDRVLRVRTDRAGQFRFSRVGAGEWTLRVWAAGYMASVPEEMVRAAGPRAVTVQAGEAVEGLRVRLLGEGVIAGRVTSSGRALMNAVVSADHVQRVNGRRVLMPAGMAYTDDHGEFRLHGLAPGRYFVSASQAGDAEEGPEPGFFPGTQRGAEAVAVEVVAGGAPAQATFALQRARRWSVHGQVVLPERAAQAQIVLRPVDALAAMKFGEVQGQADGRTGVFAVDGVWPGEYEAIATAELEGEMLRGVARVVVQHGDVSGVRVAVRQALRVQGMVATEGAKACAVGAMHVELRRDDDAGVLRAGVLPDGAFTVEGVMPGAYRVDASGLEGSCYLQRVEQEGRAVNEGRVELLQAGAAFRVVLAADGATLRGVVRGDGAGASVAVRRGEEERRVMADQTGGFMVEGLAPGEYDVSVGDAGQAVRVDLQAGGESRVELRAARVE